MASSLPLVLHLLIVLVPSFIVQEFSLQGNQLRLLDDIYAEFYGERCSGRSFENDPVAMFLIVEGRKFCPTIAYELLSSHCV